MKKKINMHLMAVTAIAIISVVVFTSFVYYRMFEKEIMADLKNYAMILQESGIFESNPVSLPKMKDGIRLTLVEHDGTVHYDSVADAEKMDNHMNRPEIKQALKKGEGSSIRQSSTLSKSNFYYALRLTKGNVLRVSKETGNIWSVYRTVFPIIFCLCIVLFLFCAYLGHFLTKSIIRPIEQVAANLDHIERVCTYKELRPITTLIREQHEDILRSVSLRQEFTANVSHELKTPLTVISGYAELIENKMATEENTVRFAGEIHRNSQRLLSLINDIIKLSELDAADEKLITREDVDLYELAKNSVSMLETSAEKHNVTLHFEGETKVVSGSRDMLEEVLYNLIDNAIRYNNPGGNVWVSVSDKLVVKDDGIGISKEHQDRVYERFFRVDKSRSKKTGGTGLGLAIVKHIVELHDAKMELQSEVGKGTTISILFDENVVEE